MFGESHILACLHNEIFLLLEFIDSSRCLLDINFIEGPSLIKSLFCFLFNQSKLLLLFTFLSFIDFIFFDDSDVGNVSFDFVEAFVGGVGVVDTYASESKTVLANVEHVLAGNLMMFFDWRIHQR